MENFWDKPHKELDKRLDKRIVFYSVDEDMDAIAIEGTAQVTMPHDGFWGEGKDYISPIVVNPTWLQLAMFANEGINVTGDNHHVFFENVRCVGIEIITGVQTYKFSMGS